MVTAFLACTGQKMPVFWEFLARPLDALKVGWGHPHLAFFFVYVFPLCRIECEELKVFHIPQFSKLVGLANTVLSGALDQRQLLWESMLQNLRTIPFEIQL
jgi:hypothetical protein